MTQTKFAEQLVRIVLADRKEPADGEKLLTEPVTTRMPVEMASLLNSAAEATGESRTDLILACIRRSLGVVVAEIFDRREKARKDWEKSQRGVIPEGQPEPRTPTLKKAHQKN